MDIPDIPGGFAFWCGAALFAWLIIAVGGLYLRRSLSLIFPILFGIGSLLILICAITGTTGTIYLPLPLFLGDAGIVLTVDLLSRWFLGIIGLVGIPVALFSPGYFRHLQERIAVGVVWSGLALLFISMVGVVLAANAIFFLVAWELMALSSFLLVASEHSLRHIRHAAMVYLGATRAGTAFLMAGFLWAHHITGSWSFADWHIAGVAALGPAFLILLGLLTKAGSWPFHLWLPIAHPAAPAPVSAVMSGVMIKTAIYAMVRFFVIGDHISAPYLAVAILVLGAISAFWGVLFALLQHDLKRLLAYSSVENIGIILMGIGIAILGREMTLPALAQLGLAAALLHTLNHAIFKSLLFLGCGAVDAQTHIRDVEFMGGLLRNMPWTGAGFIVGSAAICALPPMNGFVSEWLLYNGFFQMALHGPTAIVRLGAILLLGWLALVGALAIACFAKAVGVVFLGLPRSAAAAHAKEADRGMVTAQIILAVCCAVFGVMAVALLRPLGQVTALLGEIKPLAEYWTIPMPVLVILLVATVSAITLGVTALARGQKTKRYITWECGFGTLNARMQYSAASFAQPIARLFGGLYNYVMRIDRRGRNRRHFSEEISATMTHEPYLETRVYNPMLHLIRRLASAFLMRLQAGSIHQYLLYMLLVLALLFWVGARQ
ncbi:MAG: proton-conducting transporter membrane subunit [bacterium]